jgi:hypothetical protein
MLKLKISRDKEILLPPPILELFDIENTSLRYVERRTKRIYFNAETNYLAKLVKRGGIKNRILLARDIEFKNPYFCFNSKDYFIEDVKND